MALRTRRTVPKSMEGGSSGISESISIGGEDVSVSLLFTSFSSSWSSGNVERMKQKVEITMTPRETKAAT